MAVAAAAEEEEEEEDEEEEEVVVSPSACNGCPGAGLQSDSSQGFSVSLQDPGYPGRTMGIILTAKKCEI